MPTYNDADEKLVAGEEENNASTGPSKDAIKKLDQIIQVSCQTPLSCNSASLTNLKNFHTKAAIVILQSRVSLPIVLTKDQTKKVNKWVRGYTKL